MNLTPESALRPRAGSEVEPAIGPAIGSPIGPSCSSEIGHAPSHALSLAPGLATLHAWRHPRAEGATDRCIGHTDLRVDPRRAKRLAHLIRQQARRHGLPHIVVTSQLARSRCVGRWLARWGWQHRVDAALAEADFGRWDGQRWADIPRAAIDAWCEDFVHHAPGGGESVAQILSRVRGFDPGPARIVVTHGGWLSAALWLASSGEQAPRADEWPLPPRHGQRAQLDQQ